MTTARTILYKEQTKRQEQGKQTNKQTIEFHHKERHD